MKSGFFFLAAPITILASSVAAEEASPPPPSSGMHFVTKPWPPATLENIIEAVNDCASAAEIEKVDAGTLVERGWVNLSKNMKGNSLNIQPQYFSKGNSLIIVAYPPSNNGKDNAICRINSTVIENELFSAYFPKIQEALAKKFIPLGEKDGSSHFAVANTYYDSEKLSWEEFSNQISRADIGPDFIVLTKQHFDRTSNFHVTVTNRLLWEQDEE